MNTFSITAPRFSEDDEQRERESVSPEEWAEIQRDLYGQDASSDIEEVDDSLESKLTVKAAIAALEESKRSANEGALAKCPELVDSESDPVRFLRCCDRDSMEAARLLAGYWETRARLFGENAFRPLKSTREEGPMTDEAVELLESGLWTRLEDDAKNRSVLFYNPSKLPTNTMRYRLAIVSVNVAFHEAM